MKPRVVMTIPDGVDVSDGFHSFEELYEHRCRLWIALCRVHARTTSPTAECWRSRAHSDGGSIAGWFLLGLRKAKGKQMTYHLPDRLWDACSFAETLPAAPEFDGHTSDDVLERLVLL